MRIRSPGSRASSVGGVAARLLLLGLIVTLAATGCSDDTPVVRPGSPGGPTVTGTPPPAGPTAADTAFVRDMMVHHTQAILMAGWARTRARDIAVRALAERIRVGQQPEIEAMGAMLTGWGETPPDLTHAEHENHSGMPGMATPVELAALRRASGTAFDKLFLRLMIRHHQGAVTMSRGLAGQDPRTADLAQEIGVGQTKEIAIMQRLQGSL